MSKANSMHSMELCCRERVVRLSVCSSVTPRYCIKWLSSTFILFSFLRTKRCGLGLTAKLHDMPVTVLYNWATS